MVKKNLVKNQLKDSRETQEDIRRLVLARIRAASGDLSVSIGDIAKGYSKKDLIKSVEAGNKVGKEIVDIQMEYLRDMAQGKIYFDNGNIDNQTKL